MIKKFDNLIFLDTETTGLEEQDRLFQIAYEFQGKEYNELFKPIVPITIEAMETTNFTNKDVKDKKPFQGSKMEKHLQEILKDNILVAHNAKFDVKMLEKEGLRVGKFIDTLKIARHLDPQAKLGAYRLQYLRYALDLEIEEAQAHDALGDIRVLKALFIRLYEKLLKEINDEKSVIEKMIEISETPILIRRINFGKYKGQLVADVAQNDKSYLE